MDTRNVQLVRQLDTVGWALFLIWIGVAFLARLDWGWSLFGVATIILGGEAVRVFKRLPVQWFWIAAGVTCLLVAVWNLLAISRPIIPILIIALGVVLLVEAFRRPRTQHDAGRSDAPTP